MSALDIFTFIVFAILIGSAIAVFVILGRMPGQIARRREHPYADGVNVASWVGVLTLGILWPLALIWAYTTPSQGVVRPSGEKAGSGASDSRFAQLQLRIEELEKELRELGGGQS